MVIGEKPHYDLNNAPALFDKFMKDYNRNYKDAIDREVHYQIFVNSLKEINEANARSSPTVYDINGFADYTKEEERHLRGLLIGNVPFLLS
ncbi:unnamed protein product [Danaus chrysippus]|uniref:(African queen) hypothetical protein n=1 Tax=Danaus chrysippus TaxID=151541 RepID=A0A8J2R4T7_9NEOP|nr:unnamed protein product [Danaus chrysippus]